MKGLVLAAILGLVVSGCETTRVYTPSPSQIASRAGYNIRNKVDIAVFDARADKENNATEENLIQIIKNAYSNSTNIVPFFSPARNNAITLRIKIMHMESRFKSALSFASTANSTIHNFQAQSTAYGAWGGVIQTSGVINSSSLSTTVSGEGRWYGGVYATIDVFDKRNNGLTQFSIPVAAQYDESNTFGYFTADSTVKKAWQDALVKITSFIDATVTYIFENENR